MGNEKDKPDNPPDDTEIVKYTVTVVNGQGGGQYGENTEATITAYTVNGRVFKEWQIDGEKVSENKSYTFTVTHDVTVTAVYKVAVKPHAHDDAVEVSDQWYWFNFSQGMPNFSSSDKALSFDYKPIDKSTNVGNDFWFTLWLADWGSPRLTGIIYVDVVNNTVTDGTNLIGNIEETDDDWYRVTIFCKDLPVNRAEGATGKETLGSFIFNAVNHAVLFDEVGFVTVEEFKPVPEPTETHIILVSGFDVAIPDYNSAAVSAIKFDLYAPQETEEIKFRLYGDADRYFGTYYFRNGVMVGTDGFNKVGVSCEDLGGKTYRLTFDLGKLSGGSASAPAKIIGIKDDGSKNLNGEYMDNLVFSYDETSCNDVISLGVVDNTAQIVKTASAPAVRETTLSFSGAKGERETAQLIMYATSDVVNKAFIVKFTDFVGTNGVIPQNAVSTYIELYNNVTTQFFAGTVSGNNMEFGYFPNGLLPLSVAIAAGENKLNLASGNNQGLFFIMNIPETAAKGTYYGNVIITVDGSDTLYLPVEIEVYGFALPEQNQARTEFLLKEAELKGLYGETVWDTDAIYLEGVKMLSERGISAGNVPGSPYNSGSMPTYINNLKAAAVNPDINLYYIEANKDEYSVSYRWYTGNGAKSGSKTRTLRLPRYDTIEINNVKYYGLKDILTLMADNSTNECNIFKKAIIFDPVVDEPTYPEAFAANTIALNVYYKARDYVLSNYDWTGKEEVRDSLAELTSFVSGAPMNWAYYGFNNLRITSITTSDNVKGVTPTCGLSTGTLTYQGLNGFLIRVNRVDPNEASDTTYNNYNVVYKILNGENDSNIHNNYKIMWYTCVGMDDVYASFATNAPMIQYRVSYWQQFELGVFANHFWMTNITQNFVNVGTEENRVWEYQQITSEADLLANGTIFQGQAGDAQLMFPVRDTYGAYGVNWLSTLRLENASEGIDDYNYLAFAQSLIDEISDESLKATYQARFDGVYDGLFEQDETG
ncbi:MAG: DUF4091 domain-containing protein, partial [Clostridia bacterium]|nr:DUF4091 domain-containing protein [Clostridia bacterium]